MTRLSLWRPIARVTATLAMLMFGRTLNAQDQLTVFVHGLTSNGSAWNAMRPTLEAQLAISGLSPTLGWNNSYVVQANNLHSVLQGLDTVIAVTHSNGGVLTRRYLTSSGAPLVNRHVSINSPHRGARLAANVLNGSLTNWATNVYSAIYTPFDSYYDLDPGFDSDGYWGYVADLLSGSVGRIDSFVGLWGYASGQLALDIFGFPPTVLPEMVPGSSVLQAQNDATALQNEAQRARVRVSLSSELNLNGQPYSIFWQDASTLEAYVSAMKAFALDRYDYYRFHPDPYLQAHAWEWANLAVGLSYIPATWASMIGALQSYTQVESNVFYTADWNDGIVPWSSSAYPGGTSFTMSRSSFGDLAHTRQTDSPTMTARVSLVLQQNMGVPLRPPPPAVFSASISGASLVPPGETCNYAPSIINGMAPFTYQWYANNILVGTSQFLSLSVNSPGTDLSLVVRDAANAVASAGLQITTDWYSSGCF